MKSLLTVKNQGTGSGLFLNGLRLSSALVGQSSLLLVLLLLAAMLLLHGQPVFAESDAFQADLFGAVHSALQDGDAISRVTLSSQQPQVAIAGKGKVSIAIAKPVTGVSVATIKVTTLAASQVKAETLSPAGEIAQLERQIKTGNETLINYQKLWKDFSLGISQRIAVYRAQINTISRQQAQQIAVFQASANRTCEQYLAQQKRASEKVAAITRLYDSLIEYQVEQKKLEPGRYIAINRAIAALNSEKSRLCNYYRSQASDCANRISQTRAAVASRIASLNASAQQQKDACERVVGSLRTSLASLSRSINNLVVAVHKQLREYAARIKELKKQQADAAGNAGNSATSPLHWTLTGELKCLEAVASISRVFYCDEFLTFSLENFVASYTRNGINVKVGIEAVKKWSWQADGGRIDERRALESSLPVNRRAWQAPEKSGWYTVFCGVDVLGDGKMVATFTRKLYIAAKPSLPPVATNTLKIIGANPIECTVVGATTVRFSQVFTAETAVQGSFVWLAANGSITGNGKVATWTLSCPINSIPDSVTITCRVRSAAGIDYRSEQRFTLSDRAAREALQTIAEARNSDPKKILASLKALGITIDNPVGSDGVPELWTREQLYYTLKTINSLPRHISETLVNLKRVTSFMSSGVLGFVYRGTPRVYICDSATRGGLFEETLVHEMAHVFYFDKRNLEVAKKWETTFWENDKLKASIAEMPVSSYGKSSKYEDFAEACRYYWLNGPKMKANQPLRYEFIRANIFKSEYSQPNPVSKESIAPKAN